MSLQKYTLAKAVSVYILNISPSESKASPSLCFYGFKEKGYLYYLGKNGNVWRSKMARAGKGGGNAEKVADAGVSRESGWLYFIDKGGNVARAKMARGRK